MEAPKTSPVVKSCGLLLLASSLSVLPVANLRAQQSRSDPIEATAQRPSFSNDTSTTAPGTVELELGAVTSSNLFGLPALIKFTPGVEEGIPHGTEFSVGFDAISSISSKGERLTRFGDRVGFAVRRAVYRGDAFSFALMPQAVFLVRDAAGARLGATAIGVCQFGLNSLVGNFAWSAATRSSEGNPAQQYSVIAGYARALGGAGVGGRFSIFGEYMHEFSRGSDSAVSLIQGVSYRMRPEVVLDFAVSQIGLAAGPSDIQLVAGLTINLGRVHDW